MTALAADRKTVTQAGDYITLPVYTGTTIYLGSLVNVRADGYAVPAANTSGHIFMGVAEEHVVNAGASGAKTVLVRRRGIAHMVASGLAVANIGDDLYITDDQTVQVAAANVRCGKLAYYESATVAPLDIDPLRLASSPGQDLFTISAHLATIGTGNPTAIAFEQPRAFTVLRGYAKLQTAPGGTDAVTVTITDGTSPKTLVITGAATTAQDEAINQAYAADTSISITADDTATTGAGLEVIFICQYN